MRVHPSRAAAAALLAGLCGLAAPAGGSGAGAPAAAGPPPAREAMLRRLPLQPLRGRLQLRGPDVSLLRGANGGPIFLQYREGGRSRQLSYQPPDALEITVEASVSQAPSPFGLAYSYRLVSAPASRQSAVDLVVGFTGPIHGLASPQGWEARPLASMPALDWSSQAGLGPGRTAAGFRFSARPGGGSEGLEKSSGGLPGFVYGRGSLPGIVTCSVVGAAHPPSAPAGSPPALAAALAALPQFPRNGVSGSTVGPLELPAGDPVAALLDRMTESVKASLALGWIERRETADGYRRALDAIRREWIAGKGQGKGKQSLTHLELKSVERQSAADWSERRLTSEAYALLSYNSYWLADWLEHHPP